EFRRVLSDLCCSICCSPSPMAPDRPDVCAVVVGSLDSPYLPRTLAALAGQFHAPERVLLAVLPDVEGRTGPTSSDGEGEPEGGPSPEVADDLLNEAGLGSGRGPDVAPGGGRGVPVRACHCFSVAVDTALGPTEGDPGAWLWLLHDDSAPDPAALGHLLAAVDRSDSVAVAGVKQVEWDEPDRLISVGVDMTVDGQRF